MCTLGGKVIKDQIIYSTFWDHQMRMTCKPKLDVHWKVDSLERGAREVTEEILGMLSTRVSPKDLTLDHSHPQLSYKPIPSPTGPKPHIDLSTSKTQPITSTQTSPYPKPSIKIGPLSLPRSSPHQTKAHFANHSLPGNIHPKFIA